MSVPVFLLPKNQNNTQRTGFALGLITIVLLIFLHNPLDGYRIVQPKNRYETIINPKCTNKEVKDLERLDLQSNAPIHRWNEWVDGYFDPLPDGIASWPYVKQLEWQNTFRRRATEIRDRCVEIRTYTDEETLPFSEWRSNDPLVSWFGSIIHLLGAVFAIVVATLIWLSVFHIKPDSAIKP